MPWSKERNRILELKDASGSCLFSLCFAVSSKDPDLCTLVKCRILAWSEGSGVCRKSHLALHVGRATVTLVSGDGPVTIV